ncbi:MAG TPA: ABC transporter ATP-binding protein [Alphaproteobacteria bacterium]|nr:ABC transporter ATP-binding protein [Alphaproteobacteria bacterium]
MAAELLRASGLEAGYGRVQVLWGAGLGVHARETVVLLGANGAGKTTLLKVLMGLLPAWQGAIAFAGADVTALRTDKRVRSGMVYMSETGCFPGLTVEENLRIGGQFMAAADLRAKIAELYGIFPAIAERKSALASSLSGGQRKMLGIAKALVANPTLLLMDEPSAGLSPLFVKEVIRVLGRFRGSGLSLLIAEQNVRFLDLADRVYTLEGGRVGFEGSVAAMHENDALRRAYFGLK